jgi:hypothetical protein
LFRRASVARHFVQELKCTASARGALTAYYEGCSAQPTDIEGPTDGRIPGDRWDQWNEIQEFGVVQDGDTWFVRVGQQTADSKWVVISEGSGP